jgi:hypothetical protein
MAVVIAASWGHFGQLLNISLPNSLHCSLAVT